MDCRSARALMSARAQAEQAGGALLLAGLQPIVRGLLSVLDLIEPFPVLSDVEEARNVCWEPFRQMPSCAGWPGPGFG
jgi:hypothetical protein